MTVDPDAFLRPKSERHARFQVGFEPTPLLDDALHRFLIPEQRQQRILFQSRESLILPFDGGDADGFRFTRSDRGNLVDYDRRVRSIGDRAIPIVNTNITPLSQGGIEVELELLPSAEQRRLLGGVVLRQLMHEPGELLRVYKQFHHRVLLPHDDRVSAELHLRQSFSAFRRRRPDSIDPSGYAVRRPSVIQRSGDIRSVK